MEIDKFTIIQRDNRLLPAPRSIRSRKRRLGKWPCGSSPGLPQFITGRGSAGTLAAQAKQSGLSKLFVLTTRSFTGSRNVDLPQWILIYYPRAKAVVQLPA